MALFCFTELIKVEKRYRFFLAGAWLLAATVLFVLPGSTLPKIRLLLGLPVDKIVHVGIFWGLLYLWSSALHIYTLRAGSLLLLVAMAYGLLIEVVQHLFIPFRTFSGEDLVADGAGAVVGLLCWSVYGARRARAWVEKNRPL
ncbi:VanZ family protein [Paraflavisolibacter sp. H34]|uniref:VanZ family protein n=1 Tax=Huijunlia imazamoxiresistens TaxID=3127457 RepID=UPI00301B376F